MHRMDYGGSREEGRERAGDRVLGHSKFASGLARDEGNSFGCARAQNSVIKSCGRVKCRRCTRDMGLIRIYSLDHSSKNGLKDIRQLAVFLYFIIEEFFSPAYFFYLNAIPIPVVHPFTLLPLITINLNFYVP